MIFKINWGRFQIFNKRVMVSQPGQETPVKFYFEDKSILLAFIHTRGITIYSEINFEGYDEKQINSIKMEYLSDAIELMENPLQKDKGA